MVWNKAEDTGGLPPAKDDNAVSAPFSPPNLCHFIRQLLYETSSNKLTWFIPFASGVKLILTLSPTLSSGSWSLS